MPTSQNSQAARREPACERVDLELVVASLRFLQQVEIPLAGCSAASLAGLALARGAGRCPLEQADALEVKGPEATVAGGDVRVTPEIALGKAIIVPVLNALARARGGEVRLTQLPCQPKLAETKQERRSQERHSSNAAPLGASCWISLDAEPRNCRGRPEIFGPMCRVITTYRGLPCAYSGLIKGI